MSASEEDRLLRVALSALGEPGDPRLLDWVTRLGPAAVHELLLTGHTLEELQTDPDARRAAEDPQRTLARAADRGLRFVVPGDEEWPTQLDDLATAAPLQNRGGAPLGLWVRGPARLDDLAGSVAVVGSRSATTYGAEVATDLAAAIAAVDRAVVSGAAYGIDQAAHRGALVGGGSTVAVLACGADRCYPAAHRELIEYIAGHGAVVSEALPGWSPTQLRFLARNRLIAALSVGTVVVEAAARSGALNTANWATRLNRHVLGVPGPVTSAPSEGVHHLIRSQAAVLVTSGADVLEVVSATGQHLAAEPRGPVRSRDRLTTRQRQVLDAVPVAQAAPETSIARTAGLGLTEARKVLVALAERGLAEQVPGGWRLAALAHQ
ncbi:MULTISPECIES: DNA-processing protein DprA [unclassified Nocardioides]|uniref:DNA-processing protein DprA n=1 Tax=unclassified Nocardioides TaxID=2615069 RepID=UPI00005700B2|nr:MULTISPECIES: DNA-processing protein DprA [unclassified Nocardioides]ABL82748.1 DNA protecting protein DprA [Nocardioides sp. JS614]